MSDILHYCPTAMWEEIEEIDDDEDTGVSMVARCSRCGKHGGTAFWWARDYWSFCPYCGAKMINGGLQWEQ